MKMSSTDDPQSARSIYSTLVQDDSNSGLTVPGNRHSLKSVDSGVVIWPSTESVLPVPSTQVSEYLLDSWPRKCAFIVEEILQTEKTYVDSLHETVNGYLYPLIYQGWDYLGSIEEVLLNIQELYRMHQALMAELQDRADNPFLFVQLFVDYSEKFKEEYSTYCMKHPEMSSNLQELMENSEVEKLLGKCQRSLGHSLPLSSLLLKPVQRVLRYKLFLEKLYTAAAKSGQMQDIVPAIEKAFCVMENVAEEINRQKRHHESLNRFKDIQNNLAGWSGHPLSHMGKFICQDEVKVVGAKNPRVVLVMAQIVLILKPKDSKYQYKHHIYVDELIVQDKGANSEEDSLRLCRQNNLKDIITLQFLTVEMKQQWLKTLTDLILESIVVRKTSRNVFKRHTESSKGVRRMPSPFFKAKRRKSDSTLHGELESMPQAGRRTLRGIPSGTRSGVADIKYLTLPGRQSGLLPEPPKSRPLSWSPVFGRKMQEEMLHRHPEEFEDSFESTMELSEWAEHLECQNPTIQQLNEEKPQSKPITVGDINAEDVSKVLVASTVAFTTTAATTTTVTTTMSTTLTTSTASTTTTIASLVGFNTEPATPGTRSRVSVSEKRKIFTHRNLSYLEACETQVSPVLYSRNDDTSDDESILFEEEECSESDTDDDQEPEIFFRSRKEMLSPVSRQRLTSSPLERQKPVAKTEGNRLRRRFMSAASSAERNHSSDYTHSEDSGEELFSSAHSPTKDDVGVISAPFEQDIEEQVYLITSTPEKGQQTNQPSPLMPEAVNRDDSLVKHKLLKVETPADIIPIEGESLAHHTMPQNVDAVFPRNSPMSSEVVEIYSHEQSEIKPNLEGVPDPSMDHSFNEDGIHLLNNSASGRTVVEESTSSVHEVTASIPVEDIVDENGCFDLVSQQDLSNTQDKYGKQTETMDQSVEVVNHEAGKPVFYKSGSDHAPQQTENLWQNGSQENDQIKETHAERTFETALDSNSCSSEDEGVIYKSRLKRHGSIKKLIATFEGSKEKIQQPLSLKVLCTATRSQEMSHVKQPLLPVKGSLSLAAATTSQISGGTTSTTTCSVTDKQSDMVLKGEDEQEPAWKKSCMSVGQMDPHDSTSASLNSQTTDDHLLLTSASTISGTGDMTEMGNSTRQVVPTSVSDQFPQDHLDVPIVRKRAGSVRKLSDFFERISGSVDYPSSSACSSAEQMNEDCSSSMMDTGGKTEQTGDICIKNEHQAVLPPATTQPSEQSATTQPTVLSVSARPTVQSVSARPTVQPATTQPTVEPATTQPTVEPATTQPTVLSGATQLTVFTQPAVEPATTQPTVEPATTQPTVLSGATQLTVFTQPAVEPATTQPPALSASTQPTVPSVTTQPPALSATTQPTPVLSATVHATVVPISTQTTEHTVFPTAALPVATPAMLQSTMQETTVRLVVVTAVEQEMPSAVSLTSVSKPAIHVAVPISTLQILQTSESVEFSQTAVLPAAGTPPLVSTVPSIAAPVMAIASTTPALTTSSLTVASNTILSEPSSTFQIAVRQPSTSQTAIVEAASQVHHLSSLSTTPLTLLPKTSTSNSVLPTGTVHTPALVHLQPHMMSSMVSTVVQSPSSSTDANQQTSLSTTPLTLLPSTGSTGDTLHPHVDSLDEMDETIELVWGDSTLVLLDEDKTIDDTFPKGGTSSVQAPDFSAVDKSDGEIGERTTFHKGDGAVHAMDKGDGEVDEVTKNDGGTIEQASFDMDTVAHLSGENISNGELEALNFSIPTTESQTIKLESTQWHVPSGCVDTDVVSDVFYAAKSDMEIVTSSDIESTTMNANALVFSSESQNTYQCSSDTVSRDDELSIKKSEQSVNIAAARSLLCEKDPSVSHTVSVSSTSEMECTAELVKPEIIEEMVSVSVERPFLFESSVNLGSKQHEIQLTPFITNLSQTSFLLKDQATSEEEIESHGEPNPVEGNSSSAATLKAENPSQCGVRLSKTLMKDVESNHEQESELLTMAVPRLNPSQSLGEMNSLTHTPAVSLSCSSYLESGSLPQVCASQSLVSQELRLLESTSLQVSSISESILPVSVNQDTNQQTPSLVSRTAYQFTEDLPAVTDRVSPNNLPIVMSNQVTDTYNLLRDVYSKGKTVDTNTTSGSTLGHVTMQPASLHSVPSGKLVVSEDNGQYPSISHVNFSQSSHSFPLSPYHTRGLSEPVQTVYPNDGSYSFQPMYPVYTRPANPVHTQPANLVHTQSANPVHTQSSNSMYTRPAHSVYTQPANPVHTQPANPVHTQPANPVHPQPVNPVHTQPANPVYTQPAHSVFTQPAYPLYAQQTKLVYAQPTSPMYSQPTYPLHTIANDTNSVHWLHQNSHPPIHHPIQSSGMPHLFTKSPLGSMTPPTRRWGPKHLPNVAVPALNFGTSTYASNNADLISHKGFTNNQDKMAASQDETVKPSHWNENPLNTESSKEFGHQHWQLSSTHKHKGRFTTMGRSADQEFTPVPTFTDRQYTPSDRIGGLKLPAENPGGQGVPSILLAKGGHFPQSKTTGKQHTHPDETKSKQHAPPDRTTSKQHAPPDRTTSSKQRAPPDRTTSKQHAPPDKTTNKQHAPPDRTTSKQHAPPDRTTSKQHAPPDRTTSKQHAPPDRTTSKQHAPPDRTTSKQHAPPDRTTSKQHAPPDKTTSKQDAPPDRTTNKPHAPPDRTTSRQHTLPDTVSDGQDTLPNTVLKQPDRTTELLLPSHVLSTNQVSSDSYLQQLLPQARLTQKDAEICEPHVKHVTLTDLAEDSTHTPDTSSTFPTSSRPQVGKLSQPLTVLSSSTVHETYHSKDLPVHREHVVIQMDTPELTREKLSRVSGSTSHDRGKIAEQFSNEHVHDVIHVEQGGNGLGSQSDVAILPVQGLTPRRYMFTDPELSHGSEHTTLPNHRDASSVLNQDHSRSSHDSVNNIENRRTDFTRLSVPPFLLKVVRTLVFLCVLIAFFCFGLSVLSSEDSAKPL